MGDESEQQSQRIQPGQTWELSERRADEPTHDFGPEYAGLGSRFVRFTAVVDHVDAKHDYVELTVTTRNRHLKSPDAGTHIAQTCSNLHERPEWELYHEAPSARRVLAP